MTLFQQIAAALGWQTRVNENFDSVSPAGLYSRNPATTTGLTWGYLGGNFNGVAVASGTVALTASNTNYVVAHRTTGAVTAAITTTNWNDTTNYLRLYQVVAGASTVTSYDDMRQAFGSVSAAGFTGGTLTTALNEAPQVTIASAATVNIGAAAANSITVTGTTTITAFDTIVTGAKREVVFSGVLTLTHNATSLILPTGASITTAAGDVAEFVSLGSGNWRCVHYQRASGNALTGSPFTGGTLTSALNEAPQVALASAATVNIGAAAANTVTVSGTTTITAFDSIAAGAIRRVRFLAALTLTHNATTLILPGSANITTAAGDVATMESLGSGNWRCVNYSKADGTSVVGGGGGGLTNWTDAVNTAAPNATVPVVSLSATNGATNVDAALVTKGTGATLAAIADNTATGGNKRGTNATDWQKLRNTNTQVASGATSTVGGGGRNTASGSNSTVAGGFNNSASSTDTTIAGGNGNTASGSTSSVGGGGSNTASGSYATVAGGNNSTASGDYSFTAGLTNSASGLYSVALGRNASTRAIQGAVAHCAGILAAASDSQCGRYILSYQTTTATPVSIGVAGQAVGAGTTVVMPNNCAYDFTINIVARANGGATVASWKIEGTIKRDGTAGSTAFVGTPTTTAKGAIGSALVVAALANTTLGSLDVQVTGVAATTINWVALVETVECIA